MWNKLDEQKRKIVAGAIAIVVLYVAYRFSFSYAIDAYRLNGNLKKEASLQMEDAAYPHLNKKYIFYQQVLSGYKIKKAEMDTKIWQTVSDMAVAQQVKISYNPVAVPSDTTTNRKIYEQQFGFKGGYFNLVKLLDTISRSGQVGKISQLTIGLAKDEPLVKAKELLNMQLTLSAIEQ